MLSTLYTIEPTKFKELIYGGKFHFTVKNTKTGAHFAFSVRRKAKQPDQTEPDPIWWVSADTKDGNSFVGMIHEGQFKPKGHSCYQWAMQSFAWVFKAFVLNTVNQYPEIIKLYHHGTCAVCGRIMKDPDSIERGIGPECAKIAKDMYSKIHNDGKDTDNLPSNTEPTGQ